MEAVTTERDDGDGRTTLPPNPRREPTLLGLSDQTRIKIYTFRIDRHLRKLAEERAIFADLANNKYNAANDDPVRAAWVRELEEKWKRDDRPVESYDRLRDVIRAVRGLIGCNVQVHKEIMEVIATKIDKYEGLEEDAAVSIGRWMSGMMHHDAIKKLTSVDISTTVRTDQITEMFRLVHMFSTAGNATALKFEVSNLTKVESVEEQQERRRKQEAGEEDEQETLKRTADGYKKVRYGMLHNAHILNGRFSDSLKERASQVLGEPTWTIRGAARSWVEEVWTEIAPMLCGGCTWCSPHLFFEWAADMREEWLSSRRRLR